MMLFVPQSIQFASLQETPNPSLHRTAFRGHEIKLWRRHAIRGRLIVPSNRERHGLQGVVNPTPHAHPLMAVPQ
jgi:hypothetical protein